MIRKCKMIRLLLSESYINVGYVWRMGKYGVFCVSFLESVGEDERNKKKGYVRLMQVCRREEVGGSKTCVICETKPFDILSTMHVYI